MSQKHSHMRSPEAIAGGVRRRIRQIGAARDMIALEVIPQEFHHSFGLALEHLDFLRADLQADLNLFCEKYGLEVDPDPSAPAKGMR